MAFLKRQVLGLGSFAFHWAPDTNHQVKEPEGEATTITARTPTEQFTNPTARIIPTIANYAYNTLPNGHIRLLMLKPSGDAQAPIQCRLIDYPLSDSEVGTHSYEALSYVWGPPADPQTILIGENGKLQVTKNLYAALVRLRHRALNRVLWVDAVCINQNNISERSVQVQYMTKIYAYASRVVVWVEEVVDAGALQLATTNSDRGLDELHLVASTWGPGYLRAKKEGFPAQNCQSWDGEARLRMRDAGVQAVLDLLERPWFHRVWVWDHVSGW